MRFLRLIVFFGEGSEDLWEACPRQQNHSAGDGVDGPWEPCRGTWSTFCKGALLKATNKLLAWKLPPTVNVTASLSCCVLALCLGQELRSSEQDRESALEGLRVQSENSSNEEL